MNLNKLKGKIVEKGVKKADLAAELGYSVQALNKKLAGTTRISVDEVPIFCKVLGITEYQEKCDIFLPESSQNWDKDEKEVV